LDNHCLGMGFDYIRCRSQTVKFNLCFPGQHYDEVTKQHYNHNRFYNPILGRYVKPDRIGDDDGLNVLQILNSTRPSDDKNSKFE